MALADFDYIAAVNDFDDEVFDVVPEVWPEDRWHDGWDGAASAETRDKEFYEAYPHEWDQTLNWCRVVFAIHYKRHEELTTRDRSVERIPGWIVRRALPMFRDLDTRYQ